MEWFRGQLSTYLERINSGDFRVWPVGNVLLSANTRLFAVRISGAWPERRMQALVKNKFTPEQKGPLNWKRIWVWWQEQAAEKPWFW